jgi:hypothetical protein
VSQPQPPDPPDRSNRDTPSSGEAADAALEAVEPERVLPGEDETSIHMDDPIPLAKVYAELLGFKRSPLIVADQHLESVARDARTRWRRPISNCSWLRPIGSSGG